MATDQELREALSSFIGAQPSKVTAAKKLGLSRQDLYRYWKGQAVPRPVRRQALMAQMAVLKQAVLPPVIAPDFATLDVKSVTLMRDMMLHLVSLIDLDLASRNDNEKGGD